MLKQLGLLLFSVSVASTVSVLLGQDANWDLQNYHYYNPHAFVNNRLGWDLAPAQLQTFLNPLLDLPFYWMVKQDLPPQVISAALAVPVGIAGFTLANIAALLFRDTPTAPVVFLLVLVLGMTGTAGVSSIGTTMNDWPVAALILLSVWCSLVYRDRGSRNLQSLILSGLLCGVASGLKLTSAVYVPGMIAALLLTSRTLKSSLLEVASFAFAVGMGIIGSAGFWMLRMWDQFANPIFPFFNGVFHSPWWEALSFASGLGPRTLIEWLGFPFVFFRTMEATACAYVGSLPFRDLRLPIIYVLFLVLLARLAWRRSQGIKLSKLAISEPWKLLIVFMAVSFLVWTWQHSIYRYAIALEVLSGLAVFFLLSRLLPAKYVVWGMAFCTAMILSTSRYPDWWRIPYGKQYFEVEAPALPEKSLVLFLSDDPMAYVVPFLAADARYVGGNSNFTRPDSKHRYADLVRKTVQDHPGPIYSLAKQGDIRQNVVLAYGLEQVPGTCQQIKTKMLLSPLEICELQHRS